MFLVCVCVGVCLHLVCAYVGAQFFVTKVGVYCIFPSCTQHAQRNIPQKQAALNEFPEPIPAHEPSDKTSHPLPVPECRHALHLGGCTAKQAGPGHALQPVNQSAQQHLIRGVTERQGEVAREWTRGVVFKAVVSGMGGGQAMCVLLACSWRTRKFNGRTTSLAMYCSW